MPSNKGPAGGPAGAGPPFQWLESDFVPLEPEAILPGVLRTPFLAPSGCARLLEAIDQRALGRPAASAANSMHNHGLPLGPLGLDAAVTAWIDGRLKGLLTERFASFGGASLDHHHSYLVQYGQEFDEDLGFHVDDSEVTLNLCLGDDFSGAELVMLGARCDRHRQTAVLPGETLEIDHEPGTLVVHAGCHRHRVDPIRRGVRRNLIAWLRSSASRGGASLGTGEGAPGTLPQASSCAAWCGVHDGPG